MEEVLRCPQLMNKRYLQLAYRQMCKRWEAADRIYEGELSLNLLIKCDLFHKEVEK